MNHFADPLFATLLVLVVTHTRVILAADSRKNTLYPDGSKEQGSMDKIFRTGDCYYAVSGFSSTADGSFSLQAVIHQQILRPSSFGEAVKRIARAVAAELKSYLAELKNTSTDLFNRLRRDSNSGGEIVLVKREKGVPAAALLTYSISEGDSPKVVLQNWTIDTTLIKGEGDCFWRAIGNATFMNKHLPSVSDVAADPAGIVRAIMQEGMRVNPEQIAGPVNILELTATGETWIEKSDTAPAQV